VFSKVLVALRKEEDILPIIEFLKKKNEKPKLILLNLAPSKLAQDLVSFKIPSKRDGFRRFWGVDDLQLDIVNVKYDASEFPAEIVSREARKRKCDAIIVISSSNNGMFLTDFASSIVLESKIPVLVLKD
jgi:hypothetical protein